MTGAAVPEASRRFLLESVLALLLLEGCGFRPLYARRGDVPAELKQIQIPSIGDRIGQILRNALMDRMTPHGTPEAPLYALSITLDTVDKEFSLRKDNTPSRINRTVKAKYHVQDLGRKGSPVVLSDTVQVIVRYNVLDVQYATVVAERDAEGRAARYLADEIVNRLAVHFLNTPTKAGKTP
ncbi:MAG: hypothetical protein FD149_945 [Rhodospirillaceae bacterium]|nr:MAG: hypothetical protein FD149_945 [Rhodospirillaceae bacterium]